MYKRIRALIWDILDCVENIHSNSELSNISTKRKAISELCDWFIVGFILLNVTAVILSTVKTFDPITLKNLGLIEIVTGFIFLGEYIIRVWSCSADTRYEDGIKGRLKFMKTSLAVIDLISLLPLIFPTLGFLRILRLLRLTRYFKSLQVISRVIQKKKSELASAAFLMIIIIVLASSLIYYIEHGKQPDVFSSIPATIWWGGVTLTSVGYGDAYPITALGKSLTLIIVLACMGFVTLPMGIVASGFMEESQLERDVVWKKYKE